MREKSSQEAGGLETAMTAVDVINLYTKLDDLEVEIWIDGGWGVDALLGDQTRPHKDLDIVIQEKDVPKLRELLKARGYKDVERDDTKPWNFVLGDASGHEIDVHVIVFDAEGNGRYGPIEKGVMYPADSLTGTGTIDGHTVKCISAEWTIKFHSGYARKDQDVKDVAALCDRFGIEYPEEYAKTHVSQD